MILDEIEKALSENRDETYRLFQAKLMPGVNPETILGVRTPILRKLAKEFARHPQVDTFLNDLPHRYYDENNLHGFILSECKDYDKTIGLLETFLPQVNNWATCDLLSPKAFRKNRDRLPADIDRWLRSPAPYTVRFGIEMCMSHYLDEDFDVRFSERIAALRSEEYYVNMMIAWYFATALAKQWDSSIAFLENRRLDPWVHNKTIQKSVESYRIPDARKLYLKTLKISGTASKN